MYLTTKTRNEYTEQVEAKSSTEIGLSFYNSGDMNAPKYLVAFFCVVNLPIMVGCAGALSSAPLPECGKTNLVQPTTQRLVSESGGYNPKTQESIMTNQITKIDPSVISVQDNQLTTKSTDVANIFGKRHSDVIRKLESLDCSEEFNERNFALVKYSDSKNEKRNCYEMTKDGFMFLVMGFTGKKAAAIKEAYINAFNQMAAQLNQQALPAPKSNIKHPLAHLPLKDISMAGCRCVVIYNDKGEMEPNLLPLPESFKFISGNRLAEDMTQVLQALERIDSYSKLNLFAPAFRKSK